MTSPIDHSVEEKELDTNKNRKPRPKLNDSFNAHEGDNEFDARLPLQTPDFKGRIELAEQKTSTRDHPAPIEEGDQEYQE